MHASQLPLFSFLEFARSFVAESRNLVFDLWQGGDLEVELKEDRSPVTALDRQIELYFREKVGKLFPRHDVLGEEFGLTTNGSDFTWVIDPIDGTQSLVNRVPTFGTFLALLHEGVPVLGLIDIPVLNRTVSGAMDIGVFDESGREIRFQEALPWSENDIIALGSSGTFQRGGCEQYQHRLLQAFPTARAYYDCFGHYLLATAAVQGLVEIAVPFWDVVATEALVRAAGGEVLLLEEPKDLFGYRSALLGRKEVVQKLRSYLEESPLSSSSMPSLSNLSGSNASRK